ncbi:MAG: PIG-L deacetylase family protein [Hyphomonadaceae bacterium]
MDRARLAADKRSILALGAHPDDIELGCGASLAKLAAMGAHVRAIVFTQGERGTYRLEDRAEETRAALALLGVRDVHVLQFEDTELWRNGSALIRTLEDHMDALSPVRVYTMFHQDRHSDHRAVYEASAVACRDAPQVLGYETPSSYPNFCPTVYEEVGDFLAAKVRAIQHHRSQGDRVYMQEQNIRAAAQFRGAQVELGPSEAFVAYKMVLGRL